MKYSQKKPQGSILIWTVLLGISLTTVFFFFSQRLNLNAALQRKSLEQQAAQLFLESYADYLQSLTFEQLKSVAGEITYNQITGTLSNKTSQIKGVLDVDQSLTFQVDKGKARIEWGLCSANEVDRPFVVKPVDNQAAGNCAGGYDQWAESQTSTPFTLTAGLAPVSYKITPIGLAIIYKKEWQLDLELPYNSQKTLSTHRTFTPLESL